VRLSEIMTSGVVAATAGTSALEAAADARPSGRVGGNLEVAQKKTQDVIEGALPQFNFHDRG
jgi:hypothetical protein